MAIYRSFVIPAYGHAVVYASGQDVMNAGGQEVTLHTNFKLSQIDIMNIW